LDVQYWAENAGVEFPGGRGMGGGFGGDQNFQPKFLATEVIQQFL
jgi:hypothetical protein